MHNVEDEDIAALHTLDDDVIARRETKQTRPQVIAGAADVGSPR